MWPLLTRGAYPQKGVKPPTAATEIPGLSDDDEEEIADQEVQVPANKVKLVVGPGGERIKFISKKTKCRLQVRGF